MIIRHYPLELYDFPRLIGKILDVPDLPFLHERIKPPDERVSDQDSQAHRQFYDAFEEISPEYLEFLREEIAPLFSESIYVQRVPTFRVSFPASTAVSRYHRDSEYNHQRSTVNFWLPLSPAFATNTIWIESEYDRGDFHPIELHPGQILQFDAINLRHGNQSNDTGVTRVSFDFRVVPMSRYQATAKSTVTSKVPLEVGQYYMKLTSGHVS